LSGDSKKTIIGSGLTGPLLAIMLANRGYTVDLYEKRADLRKADISAGRSINLALSHRGIHALKSAGVFNKIEPLLIPMKGRMVHHSDGNLEFQPYSIHPHEYINSVSRGELNKILMTTAENTEKVKIYFSHELSKIQDNQLVFENGNRVEIGNEIFGADGAGSVIRKHIDSSCKTPSITKPLGHAYKELSISANAAGEFKLEPNALHIWPRGQFMLIGLPNTDRSFTCTLFMPNEGDVSFKSLKTEADVVDFFNTHFSDALPLLENFPQSYFKNPTGPLATIYADNWYYKNFYLIGDAAHAVVPFFGQGMNASFEDCTVLMDYVDSGDDNWPDIFSSYNKMRKSDADAIAQMAIENYIEMRDSVAQSDYKAKREIANSLSIEFPDRFIPRYNMVSFTSIPYSEVYKRGKIQQEIISQLMENELDLQKAEKLITEKLSVLS
jgi:kynurenine 3-monooxygenase